MGLFDDEDELDALFEEASIYASIYPSCIGDLNEGEVQAIFNRCLAKEGDPITYAQILQKFSW